MRTSVEQKVAPFTGEGAYHGSTARRPMPSAPAQPPVLPSVPPEETRASTLERYASTGTRTVASFDATFANDYEVVAELPVPTQAEIQGDGPTFVWAPFDRALAECGPLTRRVLEAMQPHLARTKRWIYVDSKIQWFEAGDVPVDSRHWHVDASITARGPQVEALGFSLVHDLRARHERPGLAPRLLAYQSSTHCATQFAAEAVTVRLPELVPNFDGLDASVCAIGPRCVEQPPGSIVRFDGLSLHRAVAARSAGWRLWVRVMETDRKVDVNPAIVECYGSVFRIGPRVG